MRYLFFISLLFLMSCDTRSKNENTTIEPTITITVDSTKTIMNSDSLVLAAGRQVLFLLKNKAFTQLSTLFHPLKGVRFSPYGYVDTTTHNSMSGDDFLQAIQNKAILYWGSYDGTGDSILLTAAQYFNKFIYNADFANAEKSSLNKRISTGNSLHNIDAVYPGCNYTEYYFQGFDKKYAGMDWTSLKLVFEFYEGKNYLVAIVHDQWTT